MLSDIREIHIAELIANIAYSMADAQVEFDEASTRVAEIFSGTERLENGAVVDRRIPFGYQINDGQRIPQYLSMFELGFVPHFYQFVESVVDVVVCMRIKPNKDSASPQKYNIATVPVDATYANGYGIDREFCSRLKFEIRPVPPPTLIDQRREEALLENENEDDSNESRIVAATILKNGEDSIRHVTLPYIERQHVSILKGIGEKTAAELEEYQVFSIGDLRETLSQEKRESIKNVFPGIQYTQLMHRMNSLRIDNSLIVKLNTITDNIEQYVLQAALGVPEMQHIQDWLSGLTLTLDRAFISKLRVNQLIAS